MTFDLGPALLFCPADRPERFAKAMERADAVILDLEDAVAPADKPGARENVRASALDPRRVIVRLNAPSTDDFADDLAAVKETAYRTIMVGKAENPADFDQFDSSFSVIALCETARGVSRARELAAHPRIGALMWGAEDLVASLGGTSSRGRDGGYRDVARLARATVLLEARAHGKSAIDAVHVAIDDIEGLAREAEDAAASGFSATACIHPGQVATIRGAYTPDADAVAWAEGVLAAARDEKGVFRFDGKMIDEPVLRHARMLLARAGR